MKAYVPVDEHPFHHVSGTDGRFRISDVPPGTYTLTLRHEPVGRRELEVQVEPREVTQVELTYPVVVRFRVAAQAAHP